MAWLRRYLLRRLPVFLLFLASLALFTLILYLYRCPLDAVLYAMGLTLLVALPFAILDGVASWRRVSAIRRVLQSGDPQWEALPACASPEQEAYRELAERLIDEKRATAGREALRRADQEEYYALWAHQIKTPIAAMGLILQSGEGIDPAEMREELFRVEQYVEMALNYQKLEGEDTDFVFKRLDADGVVKGAVKKFARQFIRRRIKLDFRPTGIVALTDAKWLMFVLEQLLSNALKYTNRGSVSIYGENGSILVIEDTGIGIRAEDLPRVFDKGFTGFNGRQDTRATGIGLYLVKRVCTQMGHGIAIQSREGEGTRVLLDLTAARVGIE